MRSKVFSGLVVLLMLVGVVAYGGDAEAPRSAGRYRSTLHLAVGKPVAGRNVDGQVVVDRQGREHGIAITSVLNHRGRYRYRITDARGRVRSSETGALPVAGASDVSAFLSASGKQLIVVVSGCKGVWTSSTGINARRLQPLKPAITQVQHCGARAEPPRIFGAAAGPGGQIAVLANAGNQDPEGTSQPWLVGVWTGLPGHRLALATEQPALPASGVALTLTRDPQTGRLIFVALAGDGRADHVDQVLVSVQDDSGSWPAPAVVANVSDLYRDLDATAHAGMVTVAVSAEGADLAGQPAALLVQGTEAGAWQPPSAPPVVGDRDRAVQIAYNADGSLALAALRCKHPGSAPARVRATSRAADGTWARARTYGTWSKAQIVQVANNDRRAPLVSYVTRDYGITPCS